jgi:hypothetical protein
MLRREDVELVTKGEVLGRHVASRLKCGHQGSEDEAEHEAELTGAPI